MCRVWYRAPVDRPGACNPEKCAMTHTHFDEAPRPYGSAGQFHEPYFGLAKKLSVWTKMLGAAIMRWSNRRAIYRLSMMDDRLLSDIGLTRADVTWALSLPGNVDPSLELNDLVQRRREARNWALSHGKG